MFVTSTPARYNHNTHDAAGVKARTLEEHFFDAFLVHTEEGGERKLWMKEDAGGCILT